MQWHFKYASYFLIIQSDLLLNSFKCIKVCVITQRVLFSLCVIDALMEKCCAVFPFSALRHASSAFNSCNLKIMCFIESILIIYRHLAQFGTPARSVSKCYEAKVYSHPSCLRTSVPSSSRPREMKGCEACLHLRRAIDHTQPDVIYLSTQDQTCTTQASIDQP